MKRLVLISILLLAACSHQGAGGNDADLYHADTAKLTPGVQAVRVGEGGAAYPACTGSGTVMNLSPSGETYLPVRAAPFAEADEVARLGEGARVFVCTRSLDQRWPGVGVPPAEAPAADCGVTAAIAAPRAYAGPCKSGWVLSAFVRPSGD